MIVFHWTCQRFIKINTDLLKKGKEEKQRNNEMSINTIQRVSLFLKWSWQCGCKRWIFNIFLRNKKLAMLVFTTTLSHFILLNKFFTIFVAPLVKILEGIWKLILYGVCSYVKNNKLNLKLLFNFKFATLKNVRKHEFFADIEFHLLFHFYSNVTIFIFSIPFIFCLGKVVSFRKIFSLCVITVTNERGYKL